MKVLLWKSIEKLGTLGDVVEVKPGYARNFLFPKRMATVDTSSQRRALGIARRKHEMLEVKMADDARQLATALERSPSASRSTPPKTARCTGRSRPR